MSCVGFWRLSGAAVTYYAYSKFMTGPRPPARQIPGALKMDQLPRRRRDSNLSHPNPSTPALLSHASPSSSTSTTEAGELPTRRLRPTRTSRRPARYSFDNLDEEAQDPGNNRDSDQPSDSERGKAEDPTGSYEQFLSTDSEAEKDARIERSMGVIRKNAASRGTEGGTKYHCDVCSIDITSTVRHHIKC